MRKTMSRATVVYYFVKLFCSFLDQKSNTQNQNKRYHKFLIKSLIRSKKLLKSGFTKNF